MYIYIYIYMYMYIYIYIYIYIFIYIYLCLVECLQREYCITGNKFVSQHNIVLYEILLCIVVVALLVPKVRGEAGIDHCSCCSPCP